MIGRFGKVAVFAAMSGVLSIAPLAASAQDVPSYATSANETIHGKVASITGRYTVTIDDDRGFTDSVTMHDGTVIEPNGVALEVGQDVTIIGRTDGKTFDANEVDTDGADDSDSYDNAPSGDYYSGPYTSGVYPAYVIPIGGNNYYYGNSYGGYYYNSGYGYGNGSGVPVHSRGGGNGTPQGSNPPIGRGGPVISPIVRGRGLPPHASSGSGSSHSSSGGRSSGSSHR